MKIDFLEFQNLDRSPIFSAR